MCVIFLNTVPGAVTCFINTNSFNHHISLMKYLLSLFYSRERQYTERLLLLLLLLSRFSRIWLCDPRNSSPPGSPVPGIVQARTLEWVAISFSNAWKWKVKVKSLSCAWLLATPCIAAYQAPPPIWFYRQQYWSGVPLTSPTERLDKVYLPEAVQLISRDLKLGIVTPLMLSRIGHWHKRRA